MIEIHPRNVNSINPDQTPSFAASDLDLYCCQCPFYGTLSINGLRFSTIWAKSKFFRIKPSLQISGGFLILSLIY